MAGDETTTLHFETRKVRHGLTVMHEIWLTDCPDVVIRAKTFADAAQWLHVVASRIMPAGTRVNAVTVTSRQDGLHIPDYDLIAELERELLS
jgi:hypothetical protein